MYLTLNLASSRKQVIKYNISKMDTTMAKQKRRTDEQIQIYYSAYFHFKLMFICFNCTFEIFFYRFLKNWYDFFFAFNLYLIGHMFMVSH